MEKLPSELVSLILDHVNKNDLYSCALINKLFFKETLPLLWRQLNIDSANTLSNLISAMKTSTHSPGHHTQSVTVTFNLKDGDLCTLVQCTPFLEELRLLTGDDMTDDSLQHVARHCSQLTTLCLHRAFNITQVSIAALGQHCHQLSTLECVLCPSLDAHLLFDALRSCPLKDVTLARCHLNHKRDPHLFTSTAWTLHHYQHHLARLQIEDTTDDHTAFITTANAHGLVWPRLTHLSLDACDTLNDTMISVFLQAHPQLESLALGNSYHLTDLTLDAIRMYLPRIYEVKVLGNRRLTAGGICRLVKQCAAAATLVKGVSCAGCRIYPQDDDFPRDLDKRFYRLDIDLETQGYENEHVDRQLLILDQFVQVLFKFDGDVG